MTTSPWSFPPVDVEIVEERTRTTRSDEGFLRVRRFRLRNRGLGATDVDYQYDCVDRRALDAVVLALVGKTPRGLEICLRASLRPPLRFRGAAQVPSGEEAAPWLWELPAGLVEPDEKGEAGLRRCAAREAWEEGGFELAPEAFVALGPPIYLTPGAIAERIHPLLAEVDFASRRLPPSDGSAVEAVGRIASVPLDVALAATRSGVICDAKTEVGLRRVVERTLGRSP